MGKTGLGIETGTQVYLTVWPINGEQVNVRVVIDLESLIPMLIERAKLSTRGRATLLHKAISLQLTHDDELRTRYGARRTRPLGGAAAESAEKHREAKRTKLRSVAASEPTVTERKWPFPAKGAV